MRTNSALYNLPVDRMFTHFYAAISSAIYLTQNMINS